MTFSYPTDELAFAQKRVETLRRFESRVSFSIPEVERRIETVRRVETILELRLKYVECWRVGHRVLVSLDAECLSVFLAVFMR